jgi:hypothetical protein
MIRNAGFRLSGDYFRRNDWLSRLIGALLSVPGRRRGALWNQALPGGLLGGAEVVRRMASHDFRGSHDQTQIEAQGCGPLHLTIHQQVQVSHSASAFIFKDDGAAGYQARPHPCDAADAGGNDDRGDHDRHALAATFGARLSRWCCAQEARSRFSF